MIRDDKYFRYKSDNLPLPIRINIFCSVFIDFLKGILNLQQLEKKKKNDPHSFIIFQYIYSQRRGYLKAWKIVFVKTPMQSSCSYLRKSFFLIVIQIDFGKVVFIVIWDPEDSYLTHWLGMASIMQLYENQTILCCVFTKFLKYTLNFEHSEKWALCL